MKLVFLGSGGSWPSKERNLSSVALKMNGEIILFDCAEGTQRQLFQSSLNFMHVDKILISHFHGDHFLGIPGLIQSMYLNDRTKPLHIFGPKGTTKIVGGILTLGYFSPTFEILTQDLNDGDEVSFEEYTLKVRTADHDIPALAYCIEEHQRKGKFHPEKALALGIEEGPLFRKLQNGHSVQVGDRIVKPEDVMGKPRKGRKIVYSGDTRPSKTIEDLAKNCDVLVHDATLSDDLEEKAKKYGHSSAAQAANIAKRSKAKVLFLTHISPRYDDAQLLEDEAKKIFKYSFVAADFLEYEIKLP
ncbi:MAG: ribonuclease Z [Methanomassiliicoccales archaeon]|nr:MAG: ribonuclease Z [Methanomassiliicoccales archaeon]